MYPDSVLDHEVHAWLDCWHWPGLSDLAHLIECDHITVLKEECSLASSLLGNATGTALSSIEHPGLFTGSTQDMSNFHTSCMVELMTRLPV